MKFTQMAAVGLGTMGAVIITTALVGVLGSLKISSSYRSLLTSEAAIDQSSMELEIAILQARRAEKDFMMRSEEKYIALQKEGVDAALKSAEKLDTLMHHSRVFRSVKDQPDSIISYLKLYGEQFAVLASAYKKKGLTYEEGLQGAFRKTVHELNEKTKGVGGAELQILKIRKDEKDYLLRGESKYIESVEKDIQTFRSLVGESAELTALADAYLADFKALTAQDAEIAAALEKMRATVRLIEPLADQIDEAAMKSYEAKMKGVLVSSGIIFMLIFVIAGAGTAVGVIAGRKILKTIKNELGAEPDEIGRISAEIARGNVHLNFDDYEHFGDYGLYKEMRTMAEQVLESVKTAEKIADGDIRFKPVPASEDDALGNALVKMVGSLNKVVHGIQDASDQLDASSGQVSSASQTIAESATEQAATIEEISASMLEIGRSAAANAETAEVVQDNAQKAEKAAAEGASDIENLRSVMNEVLSSSKQVVKIIKVIDDIAFQTNLLALNAAVEAARAGAHGKGFAVVADEVRNLAARSAKAAQETAELITASTDGTVRGAEMTNTTAAAFTHIVEQVSEVGKLIRKTAANAREQALAVKEINSGLEQLGTSIQNNSAVSEETAAAAEEMSSEAEMLSSLIRFFKTSEEGGSKPISRTDLKNYSIQLPAPGESEWKHGSQEY